MKHRTTFLDGTFKRTTNLASLAQAEFVGATGTNWDITGAAAFARDTTMVTPFNGDIAATAGDWANPSKITGGAAGSGEQVLITSHANITTFGSEAVCVSLYVKRYASSPMRNFKINLIGQGAGNPEHSATFVRLVAADRWTVGTEVGGACGRVDPVNLPAGLVPVDGNDVWTRVSVVFAVGWLDGAGVATAAATGDDFKVSITTTDDVSAKILNVWGLHVSKPTKPVGITAHDDTSTWVVNRFSPVEYVQGMRRNAHNGVQPVFSTGYHPLNAQADINEVQSGTLTVWMANTASGKVVLNGTAAPESCPWESLAAVADSDLVSGVKTNSVAIIRPQMRLCVQALANTTTTMGAVLF